MPPQLLVVGFSVPIVVESPLQLPADSDAELFLEYTMVFEIIAEPGESREDLYEHAAELQERLEEALPTVCSCTPTFTQEISYFPPSTPPPAPPPPPPSRPGQDGSQRGGGSDEDSITIMTLVLYGAPAVGLLLLVAVIFIVRRCSRQRMKRYILLHGRQMHLALPDGCKWHCFVSHCDAGLEQSHLVRHCTVTSVCLRPPIPTPSLTLTSTC